MTISKHLQEICQDAAEKVGISYDLEKNLLWDSEARLLLELSTHHAHEGVVIEIGTYRGYSACLMGMVRKLADGMEVYTVDQSQWLSADALLTRDRIGRLGLRDTVHCINLSSGPASVQIVRTAIGEHTECSLLFIDGDHSENSVLHDVRTWLPMVAVDGLIVFHDRVRVSEVDAAIQKMLRTGEEPVASEQYLAAYTRDQFHESF